ncbi:MAG: hypothetical protein OXN92_07980, partial [Gammaproteobacteria bacterium]|nr:hypothetical protein [Gammaproteobacteria bacterium]
GDEDAAQEGAAGGWAAGRWRRLHGIGRFGLDADLRFLGAGPCGQGQGGNGDRSRSKDPRGRDRAWEGRSKHCLGERVLPAGR